MAEARIAAAACSKARKIGLFLIPCELRLFPHHSSPNPVRLSLFGTLPAALRTKFALNTTDKAPSLIIFAVPLVIFDFTATVCAFEMATDGLFRTAFALKFSGFPRARVVIAFP